VCCAWTRNPSPTTACLYTTHKAAAPLWPNLRRRPAAPRGHPPLPLLNRRGPMAFPQTVVPGVDQAAAFLLLAQYMALTVVLAAWHVVIAALLAASSSRCQRVDPRHKLLYVVADVTKAAVLAAVMLTPAFREAAMAAVCDNDFVRHAGAVRALVIVYGATDVSQFLSRVRMSAATKAHHVATGLFAVHMCFANEFGLCTQGMLWYGMCACVSFQVNLYKALRVVFCPASAWMTALRVQAAAVYALELAVCWALHAVVLVLVFAHDPLYVSVPYWALTAVLVRDDVSLLRFMLKRATPAEPTPRP
jgi:hypothetical protein